MSHTHECCVQFFVRGLVCISIFAVGIVLNSCGNSNSKPNNPVIGAGLNNLSKLNSGAYSQSPYSNSQFRASISGQIVNSSITSNLDIHPLNFSPGMRYQSGSAIYWMVNTSELIDETYIKWGKTSGDLKYTGKKYFATLSLYKDKLDIPTDGIYYFEIVAQIGDKELVYGPFQFYGQQNSQLYTTLPQQLRLAQPQQSERTIQVNPEGTYWEYETTEEWNDAGSTSSAQSDEWIGVKTAGAPCTVGAIINTSSGFTRSGWGLCYPNSLSVDWDEMNFNNTASINVVVPSDNINIKSKSTYQKETNTIESTITYQLPPPREHEMIKSVVIMPVLYNIMDSSAQYILGGQMPSIIDILCPEPRSTSSNSCTNYTYVEYGVTCVNTECNSGSGFYQSPCTAFLTWDVSSLAPVMGGTLQLELNSSGSLPISSEGNWIFSSNVICDNNFTETYRVEREGESEENYIETSFGTLPVASVTYECEQQYLINIYGDLTYGYFIPPDIEPNVSDIDIPVQLKPVCENEDVSNKTLVFDIKRVDSSNEYENGGHSHDHATVSTAIGFFDNNTCTTDSSGSCDVTWHPPEASGLYELKVYVDGEPDVANTQRFMVGVEGLTSLVPSSYYRLTGQTNSHPDNHWAMEDVIGNIQKMASAFYRDNNATLGINDMSLVYGGLFDIDADWNIPHSLHRLGRSVDIDSHAETSDYNYMLVDKGDIARLCAKYGYGRLEPEATIHCEYPPEFYASSGGGGGCGDRPCM
ncbi:MAG: hypothetical protein M1491_10075 [Deltaproteobacteria bacterium]|nr:hypothetical protein [Deltaproteobacteria bacterium]